MRIALLADIHANREAFEAVLARLEREKVDRIALLGDLVGYGPDPKFCTEKAMELVESGALAILGNHDAAIDGDSSDMNAIARQAIDWSRRQLENAHRRFLAGLPDSERIGDMLLVHASARSPRAWEYVTGPSEAERSLRATDAKLTIVGHVHRPQLWRLTGLGVAISHEPITGFEIPLATSFTWLAVMGAVGQPRDGSCAAAFGIFDQKQRTLAFERVSYDHFATCRKVREAGLPEALATRLLHGR